MTLSVPASAVVGSLIVTGSGLFYRVSRIRGFGQRFGAEGVMNYLLADCDPISYTELTHDDRQRAYPEL